MEFYTEYEIEWKPNTSIEISKMTGYVSLGGTRIWSCKIPKMFHSVYSANDEEVAEYIEEQFATRLHEVLNPYENHLFT